MANQRIPKPPDQGPGKDLIEVLKRMPQVVRADRLDASDFTGDVTIQLFDIPADTFVVDIIVQVSEAFTASSTMSIGDGGDVDRFMDATALAVTTAQWTSMKQDAQPGSGGYLYTSADTIDLLSNGATPSAGTIDVYLVYIRDASLNLVLVP